MVARQGWIGVDLDGTLFTYHEWVGWNVFGEPIAPMVERVQRWLSEGLDVRIVTARVGLPMYSANNGYTPRTNNHLNKTCLITGDLFSDQMMVDAIAAHCLDHIGQELFVQCYKDVHMIELWDDRAVQVVPNTGRTLAEEHKAELSALSGKAFG